jgi:hypothetical protein
VVTWVAPDASGDVKITVKVSDGKGDVGTQDVSFKVVPCSKCALG